MAPWQPRSEAMLIVVSTEPHVSQRAILALPQNASVSSVVASFTRCAAWTLEAAAQRVEAAKTLPARRSVATLTEPESPDGERRVLIL